MPFGVPLLSCLPIPFHRLDIVFRYEPAVVLIVTGLSLRPRVTQLGSLVEPSLGFGTALLHTPAVDTSEACSSFPQFAWPVFGMGAQGVRGPLV